MHACTYTYTHMNTHTRGHTRPHGDTRAQTKEEIAQSVKDELTKSMQSFGFSIIQSLARARDRPLLVFGVWLQASATLLCFCLGWGCRG